MVGKLENVKHAEHCARAGSCADRCGELGKSACAGMQSQPLAGKQDAVGSAAPKLIQIGPLDV